jgi:hypothetical protein
MYGSYAWKTTDGDLFIQVTKSDHPQSTRRRLVKSITVTPDAKFTVDIVPEGKGR